MAEWSYRICQGVHSVFCLSPYQIQAWVQILVLSFADCDLRQVASLLYALVISSVEWVQYQYLPHR